MRTGRFQKGRFDVKAGMAFVMPDLNKMSPAIGARKNVNMGGHPQIILAVHDNYVETIMSSTLACASEGKHKLYQLDNDNVSDIVHPCPPMDPSSERMSLVSFDTLRLIPKRVLFEHSMRLLNATTSERNFATDGLNALCMDAAECKNIRKEALHYACDRMEEDEYDPYRIQQAEEDLDDGIITEKEFEKRFGWRTMKQADELALYPERKDLFSHEKADKELLRIIQKREDDVRLDIDDLPPVDEKDDKNIKL